MIYCNISRIILRIRCSPVASPARRNHIVPPVPRRIRVPKLFDTALDPVDTNIPHPIGDQPPPVVQQPLETLRPVRVPSQRFMPACWNKSSMDPAWIKDPSLVRAPPACFSERVALGLPCPPARVYGSRRRNPSSTTSCLSRSVELI